MRSWMHMKRKVLTKHQTPRMSLLKSSLQHVQELKESSTRETGVKTGVGCLVPWKVHIEKNRMQH